MLRFFNFKPIFFRISFFNSSTHYSILGISKTASQSQIRKAYLQKAKQFHPDRNTSPEALQKFKQLGEAYKVISDPFLRRAYDMGMANPSMMNPDITQNQINIAPQHGYYNNKWFGFKKPKGHSLRDQYENIYWEAEEIQKENIREIIKKGWRWGMMILMVLTVYGGWREMKRLARKRKMEDEIIRVQHQVSGKEIGNVPVKEYIAMRAKENMTE